VQLGPERGERVEIRRRFDEGESGECVRGMLWGGRKVEAVGDPSDGGVCCEPTLLPTSSPSIACIPSVSLSTIRSLVTYTTWQPGSVAKRKLFSTKLGSMNKLSASS